MQACLDQELHDVEVAFEGSPMQGVGPYLFGAAHDDIAILWLRLKILLGCPFGNQEFNEFDMA